ncbi:MAG: UvrD-helicase domain-containing protein [Betaproteobacteria bacterium]|nr:UvrD-helicase domain-containing protein [Betaproteobacteria bacterium]
MTSSYLAGLNPEQLAAVTAPQGSTLILAGAGSGKTRVLTTRIAHLIHTGQAPARGILAVTFTNKAAKEMTARLQAMAPIHIGGMWIGTFHGLCHRLLRAHALEAGLPALFQIMDSADQLAAIKRLLKALNVDDERYPAKEVQHFINSAKESGLRAGSLDGAQPFERRLAELFAAYDEQCAREGLVDFPELLLRTHELLTRNEILRAHYAARFQHILVDEFQDTNRLQYQWLRLLASGGASVFAVGDDDQSIYAFRGAYTGNMHEFQRDFGIQGIIKLEQNYRSHGNILDAANALIRHNTGRLGKELWTGRGPGSPIIVHAAPSDQDEAAFIAQAVAGLAAEGVPLSDIAVLYRSNAQSRSLEHALFNAAIPYRVYGGLRFFERQEIKHALAYLRLVANPQDNGALERVINFPPRGIGARTLAQLADTAAQHGIALSDALTRGPGVGKSGAALAQFARTLAEMRAACQAAALPEQVEHVLRLSGLSAHYAASRSEADRLENLAELVNAAAAFVDEYTAAADPGLAPVGLPPLTAFLSHASLEAGEYQAEGAAQALSLSTAHAAKGLEFHTVFLSGLEEGLFPHEHSLNDRGGVEEERRLLYVAITRAKERLFLSYAQNRMLHGQVRYGLASRFLRELPSELLAHAGQREAAALDPRTTREREPSSPWHVGQNVSHPKFGTGIIIDCEGRGQDARVQVNFGASGVKWLVLEYARLSPA